jgi:hypothetical protein
MLAETPMPGGKERPVRWQPIKDFALSSEEYGLATVLDPKVRSGEGSSRWHPIKDFELSRDWISQEYGLATTSHPKAQGLEGMRRWRPIKEFDASGAASSSSAVTESALDRLISAMASFGEDRSVGAIEASREHVFAAQIGAVLGAESQRHPHLRVEAHSITE